MPRANRCFVPGCVWHITHRCHERHFLLGAAVDRDRWRHWLYEARVRYGLCALDYTVTSNHVHLLVYDAWGGDKVARSMQLIEGRTAQAFNLRRHRRGAFWEDRYHAVAVESGEHLRRCLTYIDLNMVRAGVVTHPARWRHGGYCEIQSARHRYRVLDLERLAELSGCAGIGELQTAHRDWVETTLAKGDSRRDAAWTESLAVGGQAFTETLRARMGRSPVRGRLCAYGGRHVLREPRAAYGPNSAAVSSS